MPVAWKAANTLVGTKYELSTGCFIDDRWGVYGVTRLIQIAREFGFEIDEIDETALYAFSKDKDEFEVEGETYYASDIILDQGGLGDLAEDWLNDNIAQPGFSFGWNDGEFFYMNDGWWEE